MQRTRLLIRSDGDEGGGGGSGGEKVFFDDGQVRVTESLVTIGHPWNKAFAVREISSVTYGKNKSNDLGGSLLRTVGWLALGFGLLMGLGGFISGLVFLAMRESIIGPISTPSWKAKTKSGYWGWERTLWEPDWRLICQPMERRACRTLRLF
jgi:hypothetical protein